MDKSFKKVVFKAIALAMGIASLVLSILKQLEDKNIIILLSIGLILLAFEGLDSIDWAIIYKKEGIKYIIEKCHEKVVIFHL